MYLSSWSSWPPSLASLPVCSFPSILQCAGIHCRVRFVSAVRSTRALAEILELVEDRESICEDDRIGLGSGCVYPTLDVLKKLSITNMKYQKQFEKCGLRFLIYYH